MDLDRNSQIKKLNYSVYVFDQSNVLQLGNLIYHWNLNVPSVQRNLRHPNNDHEKLRKDLPGKRVDIKSIVAKSYLPFRIYGTHPFSNLSYGSRS
jgi:hypothetical protein